MNYSTTLNTDDTNEEFDLSTNDSTSNFLIAVAITISMISILAGLQNDIGGCNLFTTYFIMSVVVSFLCCMLVLTLHKAFLVLLLCFGTAWIFIWARLATNKQYANFWLLKQKFIPKSIRATTASMQIEDTYIYDLHPFLNKRYLFRSKLIANRYTQSQNIKILKNTNIFWKFENENTIDWILNIRFIILIPCWMGWNFLNVVNVVTFIVFVLLCLVWIEFATSSTLGLVSIICYVFVWYGTQLLSFMLFDDYNNNIFGTERETASEVDDDIGDSFFSVSEQLTFAWSLMLGIVLVTYFSLYLAKKESFNRAAIYFIGFLSSTLDWGTDVIVIYFWYNNEHYSWAFLQILILLLSQIFTVYLLIRNGNGNSSSTTKTKPEAEDNYNKGNDHVRQTTFDYFLILIGLGKIWFGVKELQTLSKNKSQNKIGSKIKQETKYTMELIKLCEILFESLPSLVLATYITFTSNNIAVTVAISMIVSFSNLSYALVYILITINTFDDMDQLLEHRINDPAVVMVQIQQGQKNHENNENNENNKNKNEHTSNDTPTDPELQISSHRDHDHSFPRVHNKEIEIVYGPDWEISPRAQRNEGSGVEPAHDEQLVRRYEAHKLESGRVFYVDHVTKQTYWQDPRPLPPGWRMSQVTDGSNRIFFINDNIQCTTWDDPRPPLIAKALNINNNDSGNSNYNVHVNANDRSSIPPKDIVGTNINTKTNTDPRIARGDTAIAEGILDSAKPVEHEVVAHTELLQKQFEKTNKRCNGCCCGNSIAEDVTRIATINLVLYMVEVIFPFNGYSDCYRDLFGIGITWRLLSCVCVCFGFARAWSYGLVAAKAFVYYWIFTLVYNCFEVIYFWRFQKKCDRLDSSISWNTRVGVVKIVAALWYLAIANTYKNIAK